MRIFLPSNQKHMFLIFNYERSHDETSRRNLRWPNFCGIQNFRDQLKFVGHFFPRLPRYEKKILYLQDCTLFRYSRTFGANANHSATCVNRVFATGGYGSFADYQDNSDTYAPRRTSLATDEDIKAELKYFVCYVCMLGNLLYHFRHPLNPK